MARQNRIFLFLFIVVSGYCYGRRWMALQDSGVTYLQEAKEMLEKIAPRNAGGSGSWSEVDAISRAFAKALATDPMSMENMHALLTFLLSVPENARMGMAEAAVEVLMDSGLEDSASCLMGNVASAGPQDSPTTEIFYEKSLEIKANNPITVRSFGFALQRQGRTEDALRLYDNQLRRIPDKPALYLTRASLCPHFFESTEATRNWYTKLWGELVAVVETLHRLEHPQVEDVHVSLQQLPSVGWQYLGFPVGPLVRTMNDAIHVLDPELKRVASRLHPLHCWTGEESKSARRIIPAKDGDDDDHARGMGVSDVPRRMRIGIVMERRGNASPERVFVEVLQKINRRRFEVVVFAQDTRQTPPGDAILAAADRVVFLPGHDGLASIGEPTRVGGGGVVSMGMPSLHDGRRVIQAEKLDCILYLAMGSSLLQQLLSMGRLAPLQISFGLGHPITSGHVAVDYFVSSDLFEAAGEATRREGTAKPNDRGNSTAQLPLLAEGVKHRVHDDLPRKIPNTTLDAIGSGQGNGEVYTEQLVLFDTLTGVFQPPQQPTFARVKATRERLVKCAQMPSVSGELEKSLQPRTLSGIQRDARDCRLKANKEEAEHHLDHQRNLLDGKGQDAVHLYHCVQDFKKFHPAFDAVLHGILEQDPGARILLPAAAKVHLQRWKRTLVGGANELVDAEAAPRGVVIDRLIFLPEIEHPDMMEVVAACDVMLAPWGWGAGITAFEALALGLPVVTAPSQESVLHFSRGQIALLGLEEELIARDAEDYVAKAVRLATDKAFRGRVSTRILEQHARLFGDAAASEVATEWESFIARSLEMACQRS